MGKLALTEQRQQIIDAAAAEWLAAGLATAPAEFDAAEGALTRLYERVSRPRPWFVRLSSPYAAELYINLLRNAWPVVGDQLWVQLRDQPWDRLRDHLVGQLRDPLRDELRDQLREPLRVQLWDRLRDQLGDQLGDELRGQLGDQLWIQLRGQIRDQLRDPLRDQLGGQLWDQLGDQIWDGRLEYTGTWHWGQWDAWLWGWLDGGRRVGAVYPKDLNDALDDHCVITRSTGAIYPFADFCIVTDRPEVISRDEVGRLHCEDGPALRYRDGYALYAVHGVRVPERIIESPKEIDVQKIDNESNAEVRRVMVGRYGLDRYVRDAGCDLVDEDKDIHGLPRKLWRRGRDEDAILAVEVQNSSLEPDGSRRTYFLMVDAECRPIPDPENPNDDWGEPQNLTCLNAVASTFGMRGDEYRTQVET